MLFEGILRNSKTQRKFLLFYLGMDGNPRPKIENNFDVLIMVDWIGMFSTFDMNHISNCFKHIHSKSFYNHLVNTHSNFKKMVSSQDFKHLCLHLIYLLPDDTKKDGFCSLKNQEAPDTELEATLQQLTERPVMTWSRSDLWLGRAERSEVR